MTKTHEGRDQRYKITPATLKRAQLMREDGFVWRWISEKLGISQSALRRAVKKAAGNG